MVLSKITTTMKYSIISKSLIAFGCIVAQLMSSACYNRPVDIDQQSAQKIGALLDAATKQAGTPPSGQSQTSEDGPWRENELIEDPKLISESDYANRLIIDRSELPQRRRKDQCFGLDLNPTNNCVKTANILAAVVREIKPCNEADKAISALRRLKPFERIAVDCTNDTLYLRFGQYYEDVRQPRINKSFLSIYNKTTEGKAFSETRNRDSYHFTNSKLSYISPEDMSEFVKRVSNPDKPYTDPYITNMYPKPTKSYTIHCVVIIRKGKAVKVMARGDTHRYASQT